VTTGPAVRHGADDDPDAVDPRVARTRAVVLEAVLELIGEVGFGRVSMEAVAARAKVARSTLYRNWGDLPTLLGDALRVRLQAVITPDTGDLRGDLLTGLRTAAGFLGDRDLRRMVASGAVSCPTTRTSTSSSTTWSHPSSTERCCWVGTSTRRSSCGISIAPWHVTPADDTG
jgi:AcrR family transcriptional regulator